MAGFIVLWFGWRRSIKAVTQNLEELEAFSLLLHFHTVKLPLSTILQMLLIHPMTFDLCH